MVFEKGRMSELVFEGNKEISVSSIQTKYDWKEIQDILKMQCECCGKYIKDLKPFGGPDGAYLLKMYRPSGPYDKEAEMAYKMAEKSYKSEGFKDPEEWLIGVYGPERGKELCLIAEAHACIGSSRECRDCAVLNEGEYFEKIRQRNLNL